MPWPLMIVAAVGILLVVLRIAGARLFQGVRSVAVPSLRCPLRHRPYDVEFDVTAWSGERVDVTRCSAFTPRTVIACEKACLGARVTRVAGLLLLLLVPAAPGVAGEVVGTIRLQGAPPAVDLVRATTDRDVCGTEPRPAVPLEVSPAGGVRDAVVFLANERLEGWTLPSTTFVMDQRGCTFIPRVLIVPPGGTVEVRNSDNTLHNFHTISALNPRMNLAQRAGGHPLRVRFEHPEVVEVKCDVHGPGLMRAWIVVAAHPHYALTDARGAFRLPDVPAGPHTVEVWHERLGRATAPITVSDTGTIHLDVVLPAGGHALGR